MTLANMFPRLSPSWSKIREFQNSTIDIFRRADLHLNKSQNMRKSNSQKIYRSDNRKNVIIKTELPQMSKMLIPN